MYDILFVMSNIDQTQGHRQRLRDRFLKNGLEGFHDYEIVELLLSIGTPRKDCKATARAALKKFGDLKSVMEATPTELQTIKGIGPKNVFGLKIAQAVARRYLADRIREQPFIRSSEDVQTYLTHALRDRKREVFMVLLLNGRNEIMEMIELFEGTLTTSAVYPREVVKLALDKHAAATVFVHNHPSGNPKPSRDDITLTQRLKKALETVDISVHDHLIVAGDTTYSFADHGLV